MKKLLAICLCLGIAGWGSVGFAGDVSIKGKVTLPDGSAPFLSSITLGVNGGEFMKTTNGGRDGNYVFEDVPLGTYYLTAFGSSATSGGTSPLIVGIEIKGDTQLPLVIDIALDEPPSKDN